MPGITGDLLIREAKKLQYFIYGQMLNLSGEQWSRLKKACEESLGLPSNWEEISYAFVVKQSREWGWGTTYGPNGVADYKIRGNKPAKKIVVDEDPTQEKLW